MSSKKKTIQNNEPIIALDITSSEIRCAITYLEEDREHSVSAFKSMRSCGFSVYGVANRVQLSECIREVVEDAMGQVNLPYHTLSSPLIVGVSGLFVQQKEFFGEYPLTTWPDLKKTAVTEKHIDALLRSALSHSDFIDHKILYFSPYCYEVDSGCHAMTDLNGGGEPIGVEAVKIKVRAQVFFIENKILYDIVSAVNEAGFDVGQIRPSSVASAFLIPKENERERGVIVVDVGSNTTDFVFYKNSRLYNSFTYGYRDGGGEEVILSNLSKKLGFPREEILAYIKPMNFDDRYSQTSGIAINRRPSSSTSPQIQYRVYEQALGDWGILHARWIVGYLHFLKVNGKIHELPTVLLTGGIMNDQLLEFIKKELDSLHKIANGLQHPLSEEDSIYASLYLETCGPEIKLLVHEGRPDKVRCCEEYRSPEYASIFGLFSLSEEGTMDWIDNLEPIQAKKKSTYQRLSAWWQKR